MFDITKIILSFCCDISAIIALILILQAAKYGYFGKFIFLTFIHVLFIVAGIYFFCTAYGG